MINWEHQKVLKLYLILLNYYFYILCILYLFLYVVCIFVSLYDTRLVHSLECTSLQSHIHTQCDALGQTLFRSYGRFFAEFLEDLSLVRLGLLDLTTCVGLRYGLVYISLRGFSRKAAHINRSSRSHHFLLCLELI